MSLEIKFIYDSLEKEYTKEAISYFAKEFHAQFPNINYGDSKYSRYIPNLFFDFFEPKEFAVISRKFLEETAHPNLQFATLLFRLSLELNTEKTNYEKELMYSLVFNMLSKHEKGFNEACYYGIGFVASQASSIGVDISPTILIMNKLNSKYIAYFEEGFIDGISSGYTHLLENDKLFHLFASKYENWGKTSQNMLKNMYVDFIPNVMQQKAFNPVNAQSLFWMNNYFTNESLKNYVKEYSNKAFKDKFEVQQTNSELEQNHFQLKQELKDKEQQLHKFEKFVGILGESFEGLKGVNPLEESSTKILTQVLSNQKSYISELENYKVDNERSKKLKEGIKKVL